MNKSNIWHKNNRDEWKLKSGDLLKKKNNEIIEVTGFLEDDIITFKIYNADTSTGGNSSGLLIDIKEECKIICFVEKREDI